MPIELRMWWSALIAIAALNVVAWGCLFAAHTRERSLVSESDWRTRQWMLLLAAGYVAGCAFRSVFPVFDIPRLTLVDSHFASALVGRSVATVAELCFAAQWALLMRELASAGGGRGVQTCAILVLLLIGMAECASWHAVLTGMNLGHVIEESLWGICAVAILLALWSSGGMLKAGFRTQYRTALLLCGGYAIYMFTVDIPQYFSRWMEDMYGGRSFAPLGQGLIDAATRRTVSHDWSLWRGEAVWMSAYFSLGVWVSLALTAVVPLRREGAPYIAGYSALRDSAMATPSPRCINAT